MDETKSNEITVKARIDTTDLDEVIKKAERLNALLKEASSLAGELASMEINLSLNVDT